MIRVQNNTWLISDTHFGHSGILRFGQRPASHELIMLSEWIDRVPEDGVVLHLGDVFMGSKGKARRWAKVLSRLPGRKYVIVGNHDENLQAIEQAGFETIPPFWQDGVWFTHEPLNMVMHARLEGDEAVWHTNVHGHVHANEWKDVHDGIPVPNKRYINACVEHLGLAPTQYGTLIGDK